MLKRNHGGHRKGSGKTAIKGAFRHSSRPELTPSSLVKISYQLKNDRYSIRRKKILSKIKHALQGIHSYNVKLLQFSFTNNKIVLILECNSNKELTSALKSFSIRLAKAINKLTRLYCSSSMQFSNAFWGRYQLTIITTHKQLKSILKSMIIQPSRYFKKKFSFDPYSSFNPRSLSPLFLEKMNLSCFFKTAKCLIEPNSVHLRQFSSNSLYNSIGIYRVE